MYDTNLLAILWTKSNSLAQSFRTVREESTRKAISTALEHVSSAAIKPSTTDVGLSRVEKYSKLIYNNMKDAMRHPQLTRDLGRKES